MPPELQALIDTANEIVQSGEEIDDDLAEMLANEIETYLGQNTGNQPPVEPPGPPDITRVQDAFSGPDPLSLLWILAGGEQESFINYLRTMPVPQANELLQDPDRLQQIISDLQINLPQGFLQNEQESGIPHGPLQSSNVYGYSYDPSNRQMMVRFNNGSIYRYDGVPPGIAALYQSAMIPAKTDGSNQYGVWWRGKVRSQGATQFELLNKGPYPYTRVA